MTANEIAEFEIALMNSRVSKEIFEEFIGTIHFEINPHFGFRIGEYYIHFFNDKNAAMPFFIKSILSNTNGADFFNSPFADSLGAAFYYLLQYHDFFNSALEKKCITNSYIYLSNSIKFYEDLNLIAYNSYFIRGKLITTLTEKSKSISEVLNQYYYTGEDLCTEILSVGDFITARIEFENLNETDNALIAEEFYQEQINHIISLPQYIPLRPMLIDTKEGLLFLRHISEQNNALFYENLLRDFQKGLFSYTKEEIFKEFDDLPNE